MNGERYLSCCSDDDDDFDIETDGGGGVLRDGVGTAGVAIVPIERGIGDCSEEEESGNGRCRNWRPFGESGEGASAIVSERPVVSICRSFLSSPT